MYNDSRAQCSVSGGCSVSDNFQYVKLIDSLLGSKASDEACFTPDGNRSLMIHMEYWSLERSRNRNCNNREPQQSQGNKAIEALVVVLKGPKA